MARSWPALLLSPSLALAAQAMAYALATPACALQSEGWMQGAVAACFALSLAFSLQAAARLRSLGNAAAPSGGASDERAHFVAQVATGLGVLATLVIASLWIAPLVLSPCTSA